MRTLARWIAPLALFTGMAVPGRAQARSPHAYDTLGEGVGLSGYDPVSYFPEGGSRPVKGSIKISLERDGVTWRFASEEHLRAFKQAPERFLPQYGGWCAWAVAELGKRVDVDPLSWELRDGKLYLFYRDPGLDTRALWSPKAEELIHRADARWPALAR